MRPPDLRRCRRASRFGVGDHVVGIPIEQVLTTLKLDRTPAFGNLGDDNLAIKIDDGMLSVESGNDLLDFVFGLGCRLVMRVNTVIEGSPNYIFYFVWIETAGNACFTKRASAASRSHSPLATKRPAWKDARFRVELRFPSGALATSAQSCVTVARRRRAPRVSTVALEESLNSAGRSVATHSRICAPE